MTNVMQTASRLALIATLSASPVVLLAQTATTDTAGTTDAAGTVDTSTGDAAAKMTTDANTSANTEGKTELADDAVSTSPDAEPSASADASGSASTDDTEVTAETEGSDDPSATTDMTADSDAASATTQTETTAEGATTETDTNVATESTDPAATTDTTATAQGSSDTVTTEPTAEAQTDMAADAPAKPVPGQIVMQSENTVLARDLLGSSVYSENGESIGDINNLIVSLDGKIDGVVIGVGGFLGLGEKDVAIEMASLKVSTDDRERTQLVTSASKADLEAAEAFVTADAQRAASQSLQTMPATDTGVSNTDATQPAVTE
ncbi:PRC-barrel domain-containing protein [Sulfitobacter brevis]|uniref:PRC-barrel domain-containing protein n=1 Tax=Sulfitobacter brevis TaxID=74348 RepID=A0A1I1ZEJ6_9RHOB|nr:PRC-barrel domain-containing protein [Sulfitobacter brevis]SFE28953.1 PRC-barrel domain-containing protein [Sulfitobacter brevis]